VGAEQVVGKVHVEVAVLVIVEEDSLCGVTGECESVFFGLFFKGEVVLVDKQEVFGGVHEVFSQYADVDVVVAVVVDIDDADARRPDVGRDACFFGDVFEFVVALVDIEAAADLVGGKEDIPEAVVVKIADADAASHIAEFVDEGGGGVDVVEVIAEVDT